MWLILDTAQKSADAGHKNNKHTAQGKRRRQLELEIIDSINKTLKEDLTTEIHKGSKVSIAAACFSIYAFAELKKELKNVDELRFIFTSPTFIKEKAKREKREFYIPRQEREKNLFGSEFCFFFNECR